MASRDANVEFLKTWCHKHSCYECPDQMDAFCSIHSWKDGTDQELSDLVELIKEAQQDGSDTTQEETSNSER